MKIGEGIFINYYFAFIVAIVGCYMCMSVSSRLSKNYLTQTLIYIGDNTLAILTWHFLMFKLVSLAKIYLYNYDITWLAKFPIIAEKNSIWWIAYCIVGIGMSLIIHTLIKHNK